MRLLWSCGKIVGQLLAAFLLAAGLLVAVGAAAEADTPTVPMPEETIAPACAGTTATSPTVNVANTITGIVPNLLKMFGARITSYNNGGVVPLYDSYGASILIDAAGDVNDAEAAYPPLCGTRYVASVGGPVSEWMYCTDRFSQSCGDTDAAGNLVDVDGNAISPMTGLTRNSKLTASQEKLIAYLVQNGHAYAGVGNQAWGDTKEARSDVGSNERQALQTLIWCISDPPTSASDFHTTCDNNMDVDEQARLLAMIPDVPELVLAFKPAGTVLEVGSTAKFKLTTNVFNQPIGLATAGTATATWSVCDGDGVIDGTTLTVSGTDPEVPKDVSLCALATTTGTVTVNASATPPSTEHVGWNQSVNPGLAEPCQVYATFNEVNKATVNANAKATFVVAPAPTPTPPAPTPTTPAGSTPTSGPTATTTATTLPNGGGPAMLSLWLGLGLAGLGAAALAGGRTRRRQS